MNPGTLLRGILFFSYLSVATSALGASSSEGGPWQHLQVPTQEDFIQAIQAVTTPLPEWLQTMNENPVDFLCVGERHDPGMRRELAQQVFSNLEIDVLFLEADSESGRDLAARTQASSSKEMDAIQLLGAPIGPLLKSAFVKSPQLHVFGVEQTPAQKREMNLLHSQGIKTLHRDSFIASNILNEMRNGQRHVALYGASHCAKINVDSGWMRPFFSMLGSARPQTRLRAVKVIIEPERGPFLFHSPEGLLMTYLSAAGMTKSSFVITDTSKIPQELYNSRDDLLGLFSAYDTIIYLKRSL